MGCRMVLVTNNPFLRNKVPSCEFISGNSFDVLIKARDLVHGGWVLLSHPLYGNLRPNQHPYRSILLRRDGPQKEGPFLDMESLGFMENALRIYGAERDRILSDEGMDEALRDDFAFVDGELMRETLLKYGFLHKNL